MKKLLLAVCSVLFFGCGIIGFEAETVNYSGEEKNSNDEIVNIFAEYDEEFIVTHTFVFTEDGKLEKIVANEDAVFDEEGFYLMTKEEALRPSPRYSYGGEWFGTYTYNFGWADPVSAQYVADRVWQSGLGSGGCWQIYNFWRQSSYYANVKAKVKNSALTSLTTQVYDDHGSW